MPTAILSVYDKSGLLELAAGLQALSWKLLASGGTASLLRQNGIQVTEVAEYTGSPEILGGRVKTLHPAIHGGLLARDSDADRDELQAQGWEPIDLAAVNLYPFEQIIARPGATLEDAIENIDIGGVTLLRAAAKNHARLTVLSDPQDYPAVLAELQAGGVTPEMRRRLAIKAFAHTASYDSAIHTYLAHQQSGGLFSEGCSSRLFRRIRRAMNPMRWSSSCTPSNHCATARTRTNPPPCTPTGRRRDRWAERCCRARRCPTTTCSTWTPPGGRLSPSADRPSSSSSTSPHAEWPAPIRWWKRTSLALASDPVSAFGGVIAANRPFDGETAEALGELFVECIAAPGFHCRGPGDAGAAQEPAPGGYARP